MENKEIYVLTDGCYSDYHIVGVFSTIEKANKYLNKYNWSRGNNAGVESFVLDGSFDEKPIHQYFVIGINMESGEVSHQSQNVENAEREEYMEYEQSYDWDRSEKTKPYTYREYYIPNREGMTIGKATKVVIEKRQRWLSDQS